MSRWLAVDILMAVDMGWFQVGFEALRFAIIGVSCKIIVISSRTGCLLSFWCDSK